MMTYSVSSFRLFSLPNREGEVRVEMRDSYDDAMSRFADIVLVKADGFHGVIASIDYVASEGLKLHVFDTENTEAIFSVTRKLDEFGLRLT